jgi:hypothetical protein
VQKYKDLEVELEKLEEKEGELLDRLRGAMDE